MRTYDDEQARLAIDRVGLSAYTFLPAPTQEDRELLLVRDVLDTQVVDLAGRRLSMVSDVLKVAGSHGLLDVAAVDVGAGSLPRRMGFRRLGDRLDRNRKLPPPEISANAFDRARGPIRKRLLEHLTE